MKRLTALLLCILLLASLALPVFATDSAKMTVSASKSTANRADTINFTVSISTVEDCRSAGFMLVYDTGVFEFVSGRCTLSGTSLANFSNGTGTFAFSSGTTVSGQIFTFTMKVKDNASIGSSTISANVNTRNSSGSIPTSVNSLTIKVQCQHSYGAWEKHDGTNHKRTCSICGSVETAAHTWDSGKVTKEATCSTAGEKLYTCTACQTTKTEETDTLDHNFTVIGYAPASCEERGEMEFLCADCGYTYDDYIEAKGHSYDFDCDEECNTCGATRETEHDFGDTWFTDKTSHYQQCNICGLAQEPAPHVPGPEANETEDQVCLTCGFVLEPAGRHTHKAVGNFLSNDTQHWYLCSCGELMGENAHHWFDQGIADGQQTFKCLICSRLKTEPVETTAPVTQPTEMTTEAPAETTTPVVKPVDHVGIPGLAILIPLAIVGLAIVGAVCYVVIGLILGYRKKGKFDAKRKAAPVETVAEEPMDESEEPQEESLEEPVATEE